MENNTNRQNARTTKFLLTTLLILPNIKFKQLIELLIKSDKLATKFTENTTVTGTGFY